jgi:hypothetical protein
VTEIADFTSEIVVAMTIKQYLGPRFLQNRGWQRWQKYLKEFFT